jgi:sulfite reductase (NADPH) hemoprotein beta-component
MNACGHHHVGHIGILGVDKNGAEFYQIEIGGNQGETRPGARAALGKVIGPSFSAHEVPDAIERLVRCYLVNREHGEERFIDVVHRIGAEPFKEYVYADTHQAPQARARHLAIA